MQARLPSDERGRDDGDLSRSVGATASAPTPASQLVKPLTSKELQLPLQAGLTLASEVNGHIAEARANPESAVTELMQASEKMRMIGELRESVDNKQNFDSVVKQGATQTQLTQEMQKSGMVDSSTTRTGNNLRNRKLRKLKTKDAINLMKGELMGAMCSPGSPGSTPVTDAIREQFPKKYASAMKDSDVALLVAQKDALAAQTTGVAASSTATVRRGSAPPTGESPAKVEGDRRSTDPGPPPPSLSTPPLTESPTQRRRNFGAPPPPLTTTSRTASSESDSTVSEKKGEVGGARIPSREGGGDTGDLSRTEGETTPASTTGQTADAESVVAEKPSPIGGLDSTVMQMLFTVEIDEIPASPPLTTSERGTGARTMAKKPSPAKTRAQETFDAAFSSISSPKSRRKSKENAAQMANVFNAVTQASIQGETIKVDGKQLEPFEALAHQLNTNEAFKNALARELGKSPPDQALLLAVQTATTRAGTAVSPQIAKFAEGKVKQVMTKDKKDKPKVDNDALKLLPELLAQLPTMRANMTQSRTPTPPSAATEAHTKLTPKEAKQAARLEKGIWKQITPEKAANLMRKELLVAVTDLNACRRTPTMDRLKANYPVEFAKALAEHPDVAMLAAEREQLEDDLNAAVLGDFSISKYQQNYAISNGAREQFVAKAGDPPTLAKALDNGMSKDQFEKSERSLQHRTELMKQNETEATAAREKLREIIARTPEGSPISNFAKEKLATLEKFLAASPSERAEIGKQRQKEDTVSPYNYILGTGNAIGSMFPAQYASFGQPEEIDSGVLFRTLSTVKENDPENAAKYTDLEQYTKELEGVLSEHAETFYGEPLPPEQQTEAGKTLRAPRCFLYENSKLIVNPKVKDNPKLRAAIKDLRGKLQALKEKYEGLDFPDPPTIEEMGGSKDQIQWAQCGGMAANSLAELCAKDLEKLDRLEAQLNKVA